MRRRDRGRVAVPEELARFVPGEWPGCPHEALQSWKEACAAWLAEGARRLPFGEYGDAIDVLREAGRYRAGMPPCPGEARPGSFTERGRGGEIIRHVEY